MGAPHSWEQDSTLGLRVGQTEAPRKERPREAAPKGVGKDRSLETRSSTLAGQGIP